MTMRRLFQAVLGLTFMCSLFTVSAAEIVKTYDIGNGVTIEARSTKDDKTFVLTARTKDGIRQPTQEEMNRFMTIEQEEASQKANAIRERNLQLQAYDETITQFHMTPIPNLSPVSGKQPLLNTLIGQAANRPQMDLLLLDAYETPHSELLNPGDVIRQFRLADKTTVYTFRLKGQPASYKLCAVMTFTIRHFKDADKELQHFPFEFRYFLKEDRFEYLPESVYRKAGTASGDTLDTLAWKQVEPGSRMDQALRILYPLRKPLKHPK